MSDIDPEVSKVLKECGLTAKAAWKHKQSGKWIVSHWALEVCAAYKKISYKDPVILVAEKDAAAILVTGILGDRSEWSIGEAMIGLNYKVTGNQAGYPFAMAEKRAKDRVILKLIGLHGRAYSEEEADEFKQDNQQQKPQEKPANEPDPFEENEEMLTARFNEAVKAIKAATNEDGLKVAYNGKAKPVMEMLSGPEQEQIKTAVSETRAKWEQAA